MWITLFKRIRERKGVKRKVKEKANPPIRKSHVQNPPINVPLMEREIHYIISASKKQNPHSIIN